jgi:glycerol-3-phosphate dehydrogenase
VDDALAVGGLPGKPCCTESLRLHGWMDPRDAAFPEEAWLQAYGTDFEGVMALAEEDADWSRPLHPNLPYREIAVIQAVRHEMARTVEDVLSRRTRSLLMDAQASMEAAPRVAELMARELDRSPDWAEAQTRAYRELAAGYRIARESALE